MDLNSAVGIQIGFSMRKKAAKKKKKALETSCCLARREHLKEEVHHLYTALGEWRRTERDARGKVSLIIIYGEKPFQDQEEKGMSEMHFQLPVSSLRNVLRMQA